jgi:hypothetical protein
MVALSYPTLIYQAWASGGGAAQGTLNTLGTISGGVLVSPSNSPSGASLADGFPIIEMTNPNAGGTGPNGGDVNGIFNYLTAFQAWVNAGGQFKFNATLAAAIGGYPVGTVLQLNTGLGSVVSTVANNTQDPNAAMTGWAGWSGPAFNSATTFTATGTAPAYVLTPTAALSALALGASYVVLFTSAGTTGSNTLNVSGLGAKSLMQYDLNGNLVPAVITAGLIAACQYNGTYWVVLDALPSSTISSTQQTLVANEGAAGATVPIFKSGVLSTTKIRANISLAVAATNYSLMAAAYWTNTQTLPANFWVVGKVVRIHLQMGASGGVLSNPTFTLYMGGVAILSAPVTVSSSGWSLDLAATIMCQAVGASGTASFYAVIHATGAYSTNTDIGVPINSGISTLVANALDLQVQQAAVNTSVVAANNGDITILG